MRGGKKGIRQKLGQILRIPLGDGTYAYCQMVDEVSHAFFDYKDNRCDKNIKFSTLNVLFRCTVDSYIINKGFWEIVGTEPIQEENKKYPEKFSYDFIKNEYRIFKSGIGFVPTTWDVVQTMEPFACWRHEHIEQRLRDHFEGRNNYDLYYFRNEHLENPGIEAFYKQYGCVLIDKENGAYGLPGTKLSYD